MTTTKTAVVASAAIALLFLIVAMSGNSWRVVTAGPMTISAGLFKQTMDSDFAPTYHQTVQGAARRAGICAVTFGVAAALCLSVVVLAMLLSVWDKLDSVYDDALHKATTGGALAATVFCLLGVVLFATVAPSDSQSKFGWCFILYTISTFFSALATVLAQHVFRTHDYEAIA